MELNLTTEQEEELNKTVELILKGMLVTMTQKVDQNDWLIDLTDFNDWTKICWHVAAGAMEEVKGYTIVVSEDGLKQTWSVDGREVG